MRDQFLMVNGKRVARIDKDYDGMIFVGNYYETRYYNNTIDPPPPITEGDNPVDSQPGTEPTPTPVKLVGDVSYYYAGSQRIAMRIGSETYFLFGDHLGSTSVVMDANGQIVEKGYYLPWGGTRGDETITSTNYGYTGQMREGDIYYYGARWPKVPEAKLKGFDPDIGRFMQADTIVPLQVQGTQAFDRYAYVNNNPLRYTDPSGFRACDDYYGSGCSVVRPLEFNYGEYLSNVYGITFNHKTPFSSEQQKIVFDAVQTISKGVVDYYGLSGTDWVKRYLGGVKLSLGGWPSNTRLLKGNSVTLPNQIQLAITENGTWGVEHIIHEFGHILDNQSSWLKAGTYIGGSYSSDLAREARVMTRFFIKFAHAYPEISGAVFLVPENQYRQPNTYGNYSVSDYFAEGFMLMVTNPLNVDIPKVVSSYFVEMFKGMK